MDNATATPAVAGSVAVGIQPDAPTPDNTGAFLDQLAKDAVNAVLPVEPAEETGTRRDEKGRFTKAADGEEPEAAEDADGTTAGEEPTDAAGEPSAEDAPEATDEPEQGEGAQPALPMLDREPILPLTVVVGDTPLEGVPDLKITFKGPGGKDRTESIDKLTRLAVDGIYSEQREQRYRAIEGEAATAKQTLAQYEAALRDREALLNDLLADEGRYLAEKDKWDQQHTPQAQAERYRAELAQLQEARQLEAIAQQGERYFQSTLTPAIDLIANALPLVTPEELVARVSLEVSRLQGRRGYLTPDQYDRVSEFLTNDLAPWAQQLNAARQERFAPKEAAEKAKADAEAAKQAAAKATVTAQKTKSQVAKVTKPVGKAGPDSRPPKRTPTTTDEALDDAVMDAVNAALGRS